MRKKRGKKKRGKREKNSEIGNFIEGAQDDEKKEHNRSQLKERDTN